MAGAPNSGSQAGIKNPKLGAGDNYGMGYKAKIGKVRGSTVGFIPVSSQKLGKPPKSVV